MLNEGQEQNHSIQAIEQALNNNEHAEKMRRDAVIGLSLNLLQQLNPQKDHDKIDELFFSGGDVLSDTYEKNYDRLFQKLMRETPIEGGLLPGWQDALNIARFYGDPNNTDVSIPERAVIVRDGSHPDRGRVPEEKVLMYIETNAEPELSNRINGNIHFDDRIKTGLMRKEAAPFPDLYIAGIAGNKKLSQEEIHITGVDNLIIGGSIRNCQIYLEAQERIAIFQGSSTSGERYDHATLKTTGDIIQYGGTMCAEDISARNYFQYGGEIKIKEHAPPNTQIKMNIIEEYHHIGGVEPKRLGVHIADSNYEDEAKRKIETFAHKEGIPKQQNPPDGIAALESSVKQLKAEESSPSLVAREEGLPAAQELSEEEVGELFDSYTPQERIIIRNKSSGSRTETRTYKMGKEENISTYTQILTKGIASGWRVANQTDLRGTTIVILQKELPPAASTQDIPHSNQ